MTHWVPGTQPATPEEDRQDFNTLVVCSYAHMTRCRQHRWKYDRREGKYLLFVCEECPAWASMRV